MMALYLIFNIIGAILLGKAINPNKYLEAVIGIIFIYLAFLIFIGGEKK